MDNKNVNKIWYAQKHVRSPPIKIKYFTSLNNHDVNIDFLFRTQLGFDLKNENALYYYNILTLAIFIAG